MTTLLLLIGKEKFSPSCNKHCIFVGTVVEDKFKNHLFLIEEREGGGILLRKEEGTSEIVRGSEEMESDNAIETVLTATVYFLEPTVSRKLTKQIAPSGL